MTSLELRGITLRYRRGPLALDDVSLALPAGRMLALVGPSGGGKSSLLRVIAGFVQPTWGTVLIGGREVQLEPTGSRGAVLMQQQPYLFPLMNVFDNIAFSLRARRQPPHTTAARVSELLDLVELPGLERRYPAELSGGQQQRVALARALAADPRVLLLDEPLSRLDPGVREALQAAIVRIQRERQLTTVLVSHELREAALADDLALLIDGRLVAHGPSEQLLERPPSIAAAQFFGIALLLRGVADGRTLHSQLGPLTLPEHIAPAREMIWAIKPHDLALVDDPGPNRLQAQVETLTYRGEALEYQVLASGQRILVRDYRRERRYAPGAACLLDLPPERLFALE